MPVRELSTRHDQASRNSSHSEGKKAARALLDGSTPTRPASLTSSESQKFFELIHGIKPSSSGISSRAFQDVTSDLSMLSRTGPTLGNSLLNHIFGWTTAANVAAFCNVGQSVRSYSESDQRKDLIGKIGRVFEGNMSLFVGLGGLSFIPARILSFMTQYLNIPATATSLSSLGRASYWTTTIGTVFFGIFYAGFALWSGLQLYQLGRYLSDKLKFEGSDVMMQARFLHSKLHARPLDLSTIESKKDEFTLKALDDLTAKCLKLHDELKNGAKELLKKGEHLDGTELTQDEKDELVQLTRRNKPSAEEIKENLRALFSGTDCPRSYRTKALSSLGYDPSRIEKLGLDALQTYGLRLDHERRASKKDAKMQRILGSARVIHLKKAFSQGLLERLKSSNPQIRSAAETEFQALREQEHKALIIEGIYYTACFTAAALGIAVTILSFTTPVGGALFLGVSIAMVLTMIGIDLRGVVQSVMSRSQPGKYDKAYALFLGGMMLAALIASAGVTFGLSLSLMPFLIGGLGIALPGIVLAGGTYFMADLRQKNWDNNHLSLETLQAKLNLSLTADEINRLIKRTDARVGLRAQYLRKSKRVQRKGRELLKRASRSPDADLKRASRKMRKLFWQKVNTTPLHSAERERALARAELIQKYDELLTSGMTREARRHLRVMRSESGQLAQALREQLYLIKEIKSDVKRLQRAVQRELDHQQDLAQEHAKQRQQFLSRLQA